MNKENKKDIIIYCGLIILIILIRSFIITPVRVNGLSMYDTLDNGEIMILNKIHYKYNDIKRFDIVVVDAGYSKIIKRVVGLPGETLEINNDILYIDGQEVKEPYLNTSMDNFKYDGKISNDCYFVMGDNRNNSNDSRNIGCVKKERIIGKASLVIFPFSEFGYKK